MGNQQAKQQVPQPSGMRNPFFQPDREGGEVAQVLSEFTFKSYYNDPYFKECKVLEHKQNQELIILKEINYSDEEEMNLNYAEFERRRQRLTCENVIRLRYLMKKFSQGMIRDEYKIILLFDYILIDMYSEANNRIRMNTRFTNEEISTILAGAVKGYASIERQGIPNDKVRLKNIYFGLKDQVPIVKVADSNLFPTVSNFEAVAGGDKDTDDVFLSPEEVRAWAEGADYVPNNKSGVYSLGIAMLELCLQSPSREIYLHNEKALNFREVEQRLNIVKNKYPLGFYYVLKEMTEKSVDHRVSFQQLEQKLPSNLKNYSPNMTLSVIPKSSTNSVYVKSSVIHHMGPRGSIVSPPSIRGSGAGGIVGAPVPAQTGGILSSNRMQTSRFLHPNEQAQLAPVVGPMTTLSSQYRPQVTANLHQVNEVYTNGNAYKGQKNNLDQRHGKGKYIYSDGSYYYGDWYRNKMFGNGILYYSDGNVEYDGEWKDDMFEGRGVLYGKGCDWIKYEGEFKAGKMEGHGVMAFNDGNTYTGPFKNDRPHGKGRMVGKDGVTRVGEWVNGKMLVNQ